MWSKFFLTLGIDQELLNKRFKLWSTFVVGQGSVQIIQLFSGFFLIRWLSVEAYAQYSLAFAFQSTALMLVDFGFSGAIVALVGSKIHDKRCIGEYIKAGKFYRNRFFILVSIGCILFFPIIVSRHQWPIFVTIMLLIGILLNLYFSANTSYYTSPLYIHRRYKDLYKIQAKNGLIRFLFLGILHFLTLLNAWLAAFSHAFITIFNGIQFQKRSSIFVEEPNLASEKVKKEMMAYINPIIPGILFAAFQGQIMLFIISVFGEAKSIAEIGALSRLGQLFLIFTAAGNVIIAPYFAKQASHNLFIKIIFVISCVIFISAFIWVLSYLFPQYWIWILGSKYSYLEAEIPLLVLINCIGFFNNIMMSIIAARKWLWWWMPVMNISGVIIIQVLGIMMMDLSSTHNVLILTLFISFFTIFHRLTASAYGIIRH